MFCFSKVFFETVFTIVLSIVGESKEYAMVDVPKQIDLFNQQCLLAMLNYIEVELTEPNEDDLGDLREYLLSILRVTNGLIENNYETNIMDLQMYVNMLVSLFYMRTPRLWTTRKENEIYMEYTPRAEIESHKMKEFFELLDYIKKLEYVDDSGSGESMTTAAYTFCKETFSDFSNQSTVFQKIFKTVTQQYSNNCPEELHSIIRFGYIIYLMTDDEIERFYKLKEKNKRYRYLICIMCDALFDVHRGVNSLLSYIKNLKKDAAVENINVQILKMLRLMYYSVIDVAEKISIINNIIGIKNTEQKINYPGKLYDYNEFKEVFQNNWNESILRIKRSKSKVTDSEQSSQFEDLENYDFTFSFEDIVPSVRKTADERIKEIGNGRLIKNNYVTPSLSRHFSVYNKSWKDTEILNKFSTDYKILFALDLNAWMSLINNYCSKIMYSLGITQDNVFEHQFQNTEEFVNDKEFMNSFDDLFS